MIYANFIYFIIIITVYSTASQTKNSFFPISLCLIGILFILMIFWQMNERKFSQLRSNLDKDNIDDYQVKKEFTNLININTVIAILFFTIEVFFFDLKVFIAKVPFLGQSESFVNIAGVAFFIFHLVMIWYWAFKYLGAELKIAPSLKKYLLANIKFNMVVVIPWILISLIVDLFGLINFPWWKELMESAIFQVSFFVVFLFILTIIAPVLITRLWDCQPLADTELKNSIADFCASLKVKFKGIMSWEALNRGLLTAGVIGLLAPFRYLLLTPNLVNLLSKNELLAVVSHEVGHVKRKHLFYYLLFFIGFIIFSLGSLERLIKLFLNTRFGFELVITAEGRFNVFILDFFTVFVFLFFFVIYFRFVFGYFMRNFERQADIYCFTTGIKPRYLISSFSKLADILGDDSKRPNWHHYSIAQRIEFIRKSSENPELISQHQRKVKRSLIFFFIILFTFTVISFNPLAAKWDADLNLNLMVSVIQNRIEKNPDIPGLYSLLGVFYYELEKWQPAKDAYEKSLSLNHQQAEVLNNLAWLLMKCPQKALLDAKRALRLAKQAADLKEAAYILDTLAEAYYENFLYQEAFNTATRALALADDNLKYHEQQYEKMKKALKKFGTTLKI